MAKRFASFTEYHLLIVGSATAVLLAVLLYAPTLTLPVIYDDLLHIRIVKELNFANVWLPTEAFGFYRPFVFVPLLIINAIFGSYPNWLLHGLNILQHALNVVLLIALSWRLWPKWQRAVTAGLLFAVFPFSYQAIAVYGHNVHPTIANLMLLGLHSYLSAMFTSRGAEEQGNRGALRITYHASRWWVVTWLIFAISLLTHESAVLFGFLAAMVQWCADGRFPPFRHLFNPRRSPWLWFIAAAAIYLLIYQFLPISRAPQVDAGGGIMLGKPLYLLQTAAYPFTWLARWLPNTSATTIVLASFALTVALTAWAARRRSNWLPLLLGWGWWGLASFLIAIPLPTDYLLHGPRLLYLGSVGLMIVWSLIVETTDWRAESKKRFTLIPTIFLLVILLTSGLFVHGRLADYAHLTSPVDVVKTATITPGKGVVLVNPPQWIAPPRNTYPVGAELAAMLGDYLFADELMRANGVPATAVYPIVVPELLSQTAYPYGLHDETRFRKDSIGQLPLPADWAPQGSEVFVVRYLAEGPTAVHTGSLHPDTSSSPLAHFTYYNLLSAQATACGSQIAAQFTWATLDDIPATTSIFVQAIAEDGRLLTQADGPPLSLPPAYLHLTPGWQMTDQRQLTVSGSDQPAQLLIGVYDFTTGSRYPAQDGTQAPLPDNAFSVPVTSCPQP